MSDFNIQFEEQDQSIRLEFEQAGGGAVKSVNGKTGVVVLDADDVGAYTKPSGGIPKTDLASAVQTSLGKADSAYQKPSSGIPASDMASGAIPTVDNTLTTAGAAADAKKTGDEIATVKDGLTAVETQLEQTTADALAAYVTDTASGSIASFPDGAALPVKSLTVAIEPAQSGSGDPSPTNIRPISGHTQALVTRTGINVWDEEWEVGGILTSTENKGQNYSASDRIRSKNYIPCKGGTEYYFTYSLNSDEIYFFFYDKNKTYISDSGWKSKGTITTPANAVYIRFQSSSAYGSSYKNDISINYPSTDHDYHSGQVAQYTIDLDGTRYGGTLNVETGVLTVDRGIFTVTSQKIVNLEHGWHNTHGAWVRNLNYSEGITHTYFNSNVTVPCSFASCVVNNKDILSSQYRTSFNASGWSSYDDFANAVASLESSSTPMTYVALLNEPFEVTLTAQEISTLLGQNNIWSDAGGVEVEYRADTKLYIQKVINS